MAFHESFNSAATDVTFRKDSAAQLSFYQSSHAGTLYYTYNFLTRTMSCTTGHSHGGVTIIPFSQLDRETLQAMHKRLGELGGCPPDLPAAEAAPLSPIRKGP